jgi:hypothetical protein
MEITEMEGFDYPVTLDRAAEGGLVVSFPDVPEAITQGEDEAEARSGSGAGRRRRRESTHTKHSEAGETRCASDRSLLHEPRHLSGNTRQEGPKDVTLETAQPHMMQIGRLLNLHHESPMGRTYNNFILK